MSLRQRLAEASKRRIKKVSVAGVGDVHIRSLTAGEMQSIRARFTTADEEKNRAELLNYREYLLASCLCDEHGTPEYTLEDVAAGVFRELDGGIVDALSDAIRAHTGFGAEAGWSAVESTAKN